MVVQNLELFSGVSLGTQNESSNNNSSGQQVFNFNDLKKAMDKVTSTFEEMGPERALSEVCHPFSEIETIIPTIYSY